MTHRTVALDISQGGVKVRSPKPLRHRQQVSVTITGLPSLAGMVCWETGDCFGIRFNELVPLQTLIRWLKLHQQSSDMRAAG